eukprot:scaffold8831_cov135-Isochrysis_galbana.AAC.1
MFGPRAGCRLPAPTLCGVVNSPPPPLQVSDSRLFSRAQRAPVLDNLHAMGSSLNSLRTAGNVSAAVLREAVQLRFGILADNVQGCACGIPLALPPLRS